jgi:serine protease Do
MAAGAARGCWCTAGCSPRHARPLLSPAARGSADLPEVIERVKPSVVVVGTHQLTRSPQFVMRGTGFAVGDGRLVATNAHVVQQAVDEVAGERLVIVAHSGGSGAQPRPATVVEVDKGA